MSKIIKACIFDLGGTIVDRYSMIPITSLKYLFNKNRIFLPDEVIRKDMELDKKEHIEQIMNNDNIKRQWKIMKDKEYNKDDIDQLYNQFKIIHNEYTEETMDIIPQTWRCMNELTKMGIKTGITSRFDKDYTDIVQKLLEERGVVIDEYVYPCTKSDKSVNMIHTLMDRFDIDDPKYTMKISDNRIGIEQGLRANCWTLGSYRWSNYMNIKNHKAAFNIDNIIVNGPTYINYSVLKTKKELAKKELQKTGAHFVVPTIGYLPEIVRNINNMDISLTSKYIS